MAKKRLNQYKGRLNAKEICEGMNIAITNSVRLLKDAEILFEARRFPSSAALGILSIEESGKVSILRALALEKDDKWIIEDWKDYRNHKKKNTMWIFPSMVSQGARGLNDFRKIADEDSDHQYLLEYVKQKAIYTDCMENRKWSIPESKISEEICEGILATARLLVTKKHIEEIEIELWIKHIKPVWRGPMEHMENALVKWSKEMHKLGLMTGTEDGFEKFIENGFNINDKENLK
jgi:AbiV family abortive infection protein